MNYYMQNNMCLSIDITVDCFFTEFISANDFAVEHGGILIGNLDPANNKIIITDITTPQRSDKQRKFFFGRKGKGHQEIMDTLWEQSDCRKTYLGEWHSHEEPIPHPSSVDENNWQKIIRKPHNSNCLFFVILGTECYRIWTIYNEKVVELLPCKEKRE